jgi:UDPglucose 6-dehydrogenase
VRLVREALGDLRGTEIGLLGLAFKPDSDGMRDAPSLELAELLEHEGAAVRACDPAAAGFDHRAIGRPSPTGEPVR